MTPYDFYVVKTEDGEIRIVRNYDEAQILAAWYLKEFGEPPYDIKGHFFGESI